MLYALKLFPIQKILSGLVVGVVYWTIWVVGSNPVIHLEFFFLSNWRDLHFHEHFQLEILSRCDITAENSSTFCKFHDGRKGLRLMRSNADSQPSCLSLGWGELLVLRIESNMPFCACVLPYAYAYVLVKTRLYSHLHLSYYHSIIDSIDTHFIPHYLSFYFSTSFPKIMFWLFTEVYKKIMSNDLRSKDMISAPLRIQLCCRLVPSLLTFPLEKKKQKSYMSFYYRRFDSPLSFFVIIVE